MKLTPHAQAFPEARCYSFHSSIANNYLKWQATDNIALLTKWLVKFFFSLLTKSKMSSPSPRRKRMCDRAGVVAQTVAFPAFRSEAIGLRHTA